MPCDIITATPENAQEWDAYVQTHPKATLYHLFGWRQVIAQTYGHDCPYLMAWRSDDGSGRPAQVTGILPLVHLRHILFGNSLVSMPYFDMGGMIADDPATARKLLNAAIDVARKRHIPAIELRHHQPAQFDSQSAELTSTTSSHKSRMLLALPDNSADLLQSFKAKLRSQIKKPIKAGLRSVIGTAELLDDFYEVFATNMRDLGSPVHAKTFLRAILREFHPSAQIVMVYQGQKPLAAAITIGFRDVVENPWASALRRYSRLSPNMLLYWAMLQDACDHGYAYFDFGRSTPDGGTYRFKAQWGALPVPLHWQYLRFDGRKDTDASPSQLFAKAVSCWRRLPVAVTKVIGPRIRKHIGL